MIFGHFTASAVGGLTNMVGRRSGRIDQKVCLKATFIYKVLKNPLRCRTAADIAQAYKSDFKRMLPGDTSCWLYWGCHVIISLIKCVVIRRAITVYPHQSAICGGV
jgi:hypothetical protein